MRIKLVSCLVALILMVALGAYGQSEKIIDGPRVEGTGDTWAVIAWTTSAGGSSIVRYGTDPNNLSQIAESPYAGAKVHEGKVTHRVRVNNLQPNATYYFAVDSGQGSGTGAEARSSIMSFHTGAAGSAGSSAAMPPATGSAMAAPTGSSTSQAVQIIGVPNVDATADNWAQVSWTTNVPSSSIVRYGTSSSTMNQVAEAPYASTAQGNGYLHRVRINNLTPFTNYYFVVESGQAAGSGTAVQSSPMQFATRQAGMGPSNLPGR